MAESFQCILKYKNKYILKIYMYLTEQFISTYVATSSEVFLMRGTVSVLASTVFTSTISMSVDQRPMSI